MYHHATICEAKLELGEQSLRLDLLKIRSHSIIRLCTDCSNRSMEPDTLRSSRPAGSAPHLAEGGGSRRVAPPAPHSDVVYPTHQTVVIRLPDARCSSFNADDDSLAGFDVLYHNRMVQAAHHQARRDMATRTEETIVAPELGEAYGDLDGGGGCRTTPAVVARLEKRKYGSRSSGDGSSTGGTAGGADAAAWVVGRCAICIEDFEVGDDLGVMPCSHSFHEGCIAKWLACSRLCPCCRHALPAGGV
jgi:hypothetical protein